MILDFYYSHNWNHLRSYICRFLLIHIRVNIPAVSVNLWYRLSKLPNTTATLDCTDCEREHTLRKYVDVTHMISRTLLLFFLTNEREQRAGFYGWQPMPCHVCNTFLSISRIRVSTLWWVANTDWNKIMNYEMLMFEFTLPSMTTMRV